MKKQKYTYPKEVEDYLLADLDSEFPSPPAQKTDVTEQAGSKKKIVFESKSSFMGSGLIGQFNQMRMAFGFSDSAKRLRVIGLIGGFAAFLAFVVYAAPDSSQSSRDDPASVIAGRPDAPAENDVNHYLEKEPQTVERQAQKEPKEELPEEVVSPPPPAKAKPVAVALPQPETMIVYKYKQASTTNPQTSSSASTFVQGRLLTNIEVSTLGGNLAIAELLDGRIVYGNAEMAPELDRIYINFTEEQLPDGAHRRGVRYATVDTNKTQGLAASCSDLSGSNVLQKSVAVGVNALSAVAGARNTDAYSAQDAARERLATELNDQANYSARSGRIRSCTVQAGSQFYAVQTAMGR